MRNDKLNSRYFIPANDREIFIDPNLEEMPAVISANMEQFKSHDFSICGKDYNAFRNKVRCDVIKKAKKYTKNILTQLGGRKESIEKIDSYPDAPKDIPIIQTGHAPILYPPGIWIKNHLVSYLAEKCGGIGLNVVMDNDTPQENLILAPDLKSLSVKTIKGFEFRKGIPFEELAGPFTKGNENLSGLPGETINTVDVINGLHRDITGKCSLATDSQFAESVKKYIDLMIAGSEYARNFGECSTFARRMREEEFGVHNLELPISAISETEGFLMFFICVAMKIKLFASNYNAGLEEYRMKNKVRSTANPLPNLKVENGLVEAPFWIWKKGSARSKVFLREIEGEQIEIAIECAVNGQNSANSGNNSQTKHLQIIGAITSNDATQNIEIIREITKAGFKIRPRALTNTIFCRLFLSDMFAHGIGGAKYDVISDSIIMNFFKAAPPRYSAISATLYPPIEKHDVSDEDIRAKLNELKQIKQNPDKYLPPTALEMPEVKKLAMEKRELAGKKTNDDKVEARNKFLRIKEINSILGGYVKEIYDDKELLIETLKNRLKYNATIENRNYPFMIYTDEFLKEFFCEELWRERVLPAVGN